MVVSKGLSVLGYTIARFLNAGFLLVIEEKKCAWPEQSGRIVVVGEYWGLD